MDFIGQMIREREQRKQMALANWEKDKRRKVPKVDKRLFCAGCRENYYNGNNDRGINECWCLDSAKLQKRKIYFRLDQTVPDEVITLSCFTPNRNLR